MVTICIGPVCVPLHLLLPFLVGVLHRYGWLKWFKPEWVTLRFWQKCVGYHLPTQVQSIPVIDTNTVIAGLEHQASLSWNNLSSNPRTAPTKNAKLCTWHSCFRPFNTSNPYFLLPVSGKRMKRFLRFRLSCHSLPIETGRHHRPPIPRSSRLCPHCPLASVGAEYHLAFECPIFQPLRDRWSGSSQKVAEVKAKPDVAKADEAVQVALQQDKAATGSTNSRNTSHQQQSSSSQNNISTSQQPRSDSGRPAGLQQRKPGESELKQSPALPR